MNELVLFGGAFAIVFALSFQQHHVHCRRFNLAFLNSFVIGVLNLLMLKLGSQATPSEMTAYITGGPLGTLAAMWAHDRMFSSEVVNNAN